MGRRQREGRRLANALRKVDIETRFCPVGNVPEIKTWIAQRIAVGYTTLKCANHRWMLMNDRGVGYDLSRQGSGLTKVRPLIESELALAKATSELAAERAAPQWRAGPAGTP